MNLESGILNKTLDSRFQILDSISLIKNKTNHHTKLNESL